MKFKFICIVFLTLATKVLSMKTILSALNEILRYEVAPCYVISSENGTELSYNVLHSHWIALSELELCEDLCCDYSIIFLHGLRKINAVFTSLGNFRMYIVINMIRNEQPQKHLKLHQDNVIILQTVDGDKGMLGAYEKIRGQFIQTSIWNGQKFIPGPFMRSFQGETMRLGTATMLPYTEVYTVNKDEIYIGSGTETTFLKAISAHDNVTIDWIDIVRFEGGSLWGTFLPNGSTTGLLKYLLEYKTDVTSLANYCGYYQHRLIHCSVMHDFDGLVATLKNPEPRPKWQGLLTPYQKWAWMSIAASLIVTTMILGLCQKITFNSKKNDWPLHFLDALNPMVGRPMGGPGFNAAHLNRKNKILAFEIFLILYSLACLVINTGYEGNLKSHLTGTVYPPIIKGLKEFTEQPFKDIIYLMTEAEGLIQELKRSPIAEIAALPERKVVRGRTTDFVSTFFEPLKGHVLISTRIPTLYQIQKFLTRRDGKPAVQTVPEFITGYPVTLFLTRMNRFIPYIDKRLSQWIEAGFFAVHMRWELENVDSVSFEDETNYVGEGATWTALSVDNYRLLVGFFGCGITFALITFATEIYPIVCK